MEELPGKVRRKRHRFRPPTFKTLRTYYRLRARSNTFRLKCTKRIRRLKSFKTGQIDAETSITPSCLGCSSSLVSSWFDDEEMLFARIIALRLKKMSNARRNAVRIFIIEWKVVQIHFAKLVISKNFLVLLLRELSKDELKAFKFSN